MIHGDLTRRALMARAAGLASWASLAGLPLATMAATGSAPYPTLPGGRLLPSQPQDYDNAKLSGGPGKDGIPAIDHPKFWKAADAGSYRRSDQIKSEVLFQGIGDATEPT